MTNVTLDSTVVKCSTHVSTDLGGEVVILDMQSEEYFSLDGVGTRIWKMIEIPTTVHEILTAILQVCDVEPTRAERDLLAVLGEMAQEGLIEVK